MCVLRCVCVNVNTTDATAGATALLLPAQNSLSTIIIGTQTLQLANGRGAGLAASNREQGRGVASWNGRTQTLHVMSPRSRAISEPPQGLLAVNLHT